MTTNPITDAHEALVDEEWATEDGLARAVADALAALAVLHHEAAVEEWRCPQHGATPLMKKIDGDVRCCQLVRSKDGAQERCYAEMTRTLVVPFRSEGGDHAA